MDKILVVDDEKDIINMIKDFMKINNIEVVEALSGEEALKKLDAAVKLIILDINMENMSGIETCKKIREGEIYIPIIFLTARASQSDKILGLGIGGDDYITKPFDPIELVYRVKAKIRRNEEYNKGVMDKAAKVIKYEHFTIYTEHYRIIKNGQIIPLTTKEFELLLYFVKNANIVLSREKILDCVWNNNMYDYNVVTTNIKRLRRKIEDDPDNPTYIKTIWGVGYMFEEDIVKCAE